MSEITRVGVDLAKSVIQVNAVDAGGKLVTNRQLSRDKFLQWCAQLPPGCLVAMEACGGSHHWARKLIALGLNVKIIAAHLVAPYRLQGKGGKNDANDAAAVCEAASRPNMRFVPVKTTVQQGILCVHSLREGLKEERTASINRIRGMLTEFGLARIFHAFPSYRLELGLFGAMRSSQGPQRSVQAVAECVARRQGAPAPTPAWIASRFCVNARARR